MNDDDRDATASLLFDAARREARAGRGSRGTAPPVKPRGWF